MSSFVVVLSSDQICSGNICKSLAHYSGDVGNASLIGVAYFVTIAVILLLVLEAFRKTPVEVDTSELV
jgi:hypothetical protein